jgi:hypothetical protein
VRPRPIEVYEDGEFYDIIQGRDFVEDADGYGWNTYTPSQIKAIRAILDNPKTLYSITDTEENNYLFTPVQYKAIKRQTTPSYRFYAAGFEVTLQQGDLTIGCQSHSLDHWKKNIDTIVGENSGWDVRTTWAESFALALPYLEKMQAALARKPSKKAKKAKRKKK